MADNANPNQICLAWRDFRPGGCGDEEQAQYLNVEDRLDVELHIPLLKVWWQFLEFYYPQQLSFESDRLIAM